MPPTCRHYSWLAVCTQVSARPAFLTNAAFDLGRLPGRQGLGQGGRHHLLPLKSVPRPADPHDGAALGAWAVVQRDGGAGPLQERLGDEESEAQARRSTIL